MSRIFASGGQSIGASASVLPVNIQGWFPLGLTGLILLSKGLSQEVKNMICYFPILETFFFIALKYFKVESREEKERGSAICTDRGKASANVGELFKKQDAE